MPFGEELKRRRKARDLTQEELAWRLGCAVETVRKVEQSARRPSKALAERLADELGISPEARRAFVQRARGHASSERLASAVSNLPAPLTSLIGRDTDLTTVRTLLKRDDVRLVTLLGPPGIGKTRLGLEVARGLAPAYPDGAHFVSLVPVSDPARVPAAIAQTLDLKEFPGQPFTESLQRYLRQRHLLLVLDNFEALIKAAPTVGGLLAACEGLKILITSRVPLRLYGEHTYVVPPLAVPNLAALPDAERLSDYAAVRLFVERARAMQSDVRITPKDAPALAEICNRLDGLPLAIELAAARVKLFSLSALAARLDRRLSLLTDGPQDTPARQRTLRNTIAWSYGLLEPEEQRLFRRLGVFTGGFTLEAAAAVTDWDDLSFGALDGMVALLDKSLLERTNEEAGEVRFRMLETLREYALEVLETSGEMTRAKDAHLGFFLHLAEEAEPDLLGPNQATWLDRLERDFGNSRAALSWSLTQNMAERGLRLGGALETFWYMRGHLGEGRACLEPLLARYHERTAVRAKALYTAGYLAGWQGDFSAASSLLQESVSIYSEIGHVQGLAFALNVSAFAAILQTDFDGAQMLLAKALPLARTTENKRAIFYALHYLGHVAQAQGRYGEAWRLFEESLPLARELGNKYDIGWNLIHKGNITRAEGNYPRAKHLLEEGLAVLQGIGDRESAACARADLGNVAWLEDDYKRAETFLADSLSFFQERGNVIFAAKVLYFYGAMEVQRGAYARGVRLLANTTLVRPLRGILDPAQNADFDMRLLAAQESLGSEAFEAAWSEGQTMTLPDAVSYALETDLPLLTHDSSPSPPASRSTPHRGAP